MNILVKSLRVSRVNVNQGIEAFIMELWSFKSGVSTRKYLFLILAILKKVIIWLDDETVYKKARNL